MPIHRISSFLGVALALAMTPWALASGAEPAKPRRVVIVTPSKSDGRLAATREAIGFWKRTFAELKLDQPMVETELLVAPPITPALEAYTRDIWRLAGKTVSPLQHPPPPPRLTELDAEVVVFFSVQRIYSFAWPFADNTRYFVGIQSNTLTPMTLSNVPRNVIAHELGHVLGLRHNGYTKTLMCGPCETKVYVSEQPTFFPLTATDLDRLRKIHGGIRN
jgi:hypothetical protein